MLYYLILLILIGTTGFVIPQISACECKLSTLDDHLMTADVVFQGTITREPVTFNKNLVATFSAIDIFKKPSSEFDYLFSKGKINVTTGINSGICGVDFQADNTYIVFGIISDGRIETSSCSGTTTIDNYFEQMEYLQQYEPSPSNTWIDPDAVWHSHDVIVDGTIIEKSQLKDGRITYSIKINGNLKNPNDFDLITIDGTLLYDNFEKGDRGLFYINDISHASWYVKWQATAYSVKANEECEPQDYLEVDPWQMANPNSLIRGPPTISWDWKDSCVASYYDADPDFWKWREYVSILKQQKFHHLPDRMLRCLDGFEIVERVGGIKVCVKPETKQKLIERGWGIG